MMSDMTEHDQPQDAVQQFFQLFADGWKTNEGTALASLFVEDGALINPFGQRADGRSAIAAMYSEYFEGMLQGTSTTFRLQSVRPVETSHAFADGEQTISASSPPYFAATATAGVSLSPVPTPSRPFPPEPRPTTAWRFASSAPRRKPLGTVLKQEPLVFSAKGPLPCVNWAISSHLGTPLHHRKDA
jgi:uncharacterized protein (TIGR02246 family)